MEECWKLSSCQRNRENPISAFSVENKSSVIFWIVSDPHRIPKALYLLIHVLFKEKIRGPVAQSG